jgi:hypothetical protein
MIRRPTLDQLIDAAKNLDSTEQAALVAAINEQLRERGCDAAKALAPAAQTAKDDWTSLAVESLSRAYGDSEPEYSAEDLVP